MVVLSKMEKGHLKLVFETQCLLFLAICFFSDFGCVSQNLLSFEYHSKKIQMTTRPTKTLTISQWVQKHTPHSCSSICLSKTKPSCFCFCNQNYCNPQGIAGFATVYLGL